MFSSSRACSVTCPNIFETNSCECHDDHCFWELPFNAACFERQKGLSSFEIRGAAHPEMREKQIPVFDAPSKTTEGKIFSKSNFKYFPQDGVYVQAFDLFQQMQRMMYESGYFNIFVN